MLLQANPLPIPFQICSSQLFEQEQKGNRARVVARIRKPLVDRTHIPLVAAEGTHIRPHVVAAVEEDTRLDRQKWTPQNEQDKP